MGYTHYFEHKETDSVTWNKITNACKQAIILSNTPVQYENDKDLPPQVDTHVIRFNGVDEDGHETFVLNRLGSGDFNFCKTAHKPYDELVTACLLIYYHFSPDTIDISSDGGYHDWENGRALSSKVLGETVLLPSWTPESVGPTIEAPKKEETPAMPAELDIIYEYQGIDEAGETMTELSEEKFSKLRAIATDNGFDTPEEFDEHLQPFINQYMQYRYQQNLHIPQARKKDGSWKLRRFFVPADRYKADLDRLGYTYTEKERPNPRNKNLTEKLLELKGVPDGFYTAWKTVTNSLKHNIPLKEQSKGELERKIRATKKLLIPSSVPKEPAELVQLSLDTLLSRIDNLSTKEIKETWIELIIEKLQEKKDGLV